MRSSKRVPYLPFAVLDVGGAILEEAETLLEKGVYAFKTARRGRPGGTLRPGVGTPLWNTLVAEIRPHLKKRGVQSHLARLLGVHRQQINAYFTLRSRMPDAERTLQLMAWLIAMRQAAAAETTPGERG